MWADAGYLAAIVESSDDAIIGKDLSGIIRSWNWGAEQIFGYRAHEIIGHSIALLFSPERLSEEVMILEKIKNGQRVEHLETIRRHKDGRLIPVSLTISPIKDANGVIVGASKILRDISARVAAERSLAVSIAEFRASFEGAVVGKIMAEPQARRISRANRAVAQMLGFDDPREMVDLTVSDLTWPEDRGLDDSDYGLMLAGETEAMVAERRFVHRDGTPIWVRISATLTRVPECSVPRFAVISIENIDTRYKAQAALIAAVAQRDLLLREVYHRVANNLQIVDGLIMMQARKIDDVPAQQALLGLRSRVAAIGLVHQQLMGSSDVGTFDLGPFLEELTTNILEGGMNPDICLSVEALPLQVNLDFAVQLGLLVTELVTNSLKHAFPLGAGNIKVALRPGEAGKIVLIVADDGKGLNVAASCAAAKSGLGTGIVQSLVAQLEGSMLVRHEGGTMTEIRIPAPVQP